MEINSLEDLSPQAIEDRDWDIIMKAVYKTQTITSTFKTISVSISGGSDSDIMLDLLWRNTEDKSKLHFVFFDTGIEYAATKEHLDYLEHKYGITITRRKAKVPVPMGCQKYGVPFLSKDLASKIGSLQHNGFDFAGDGWKTYEELMEKYPHCKRSITWWCNANGYTFSIARTKLLKEYMIEHPPTFKISDRCCWGAKKSNAHEYAKEIGADLECIGVRKAEGGIRATANKNCFEWRDAPVQSYRPLFWFWDSTKIMYEQEYGVTHSRRYTEYGMKRTGCAGCPFNSRFQQDIEILEKFEPKLLKAINNVFGQSYEYTLAYRQYKEEHSKMPKIQKGQMTIFDTEDKQP